MAFHSVQNCMLACPLIIYHQAQESIRKDKLSPFNRLHSIYEDAAFVSQFRGLYPQLPVVGNQRCGTWYVDPAKASNEPAYFKSTDGHHGRWDFNMRRANLNLVPLIEMFGGIIIVDSTRRGKRFPDALSKTVPTWCCVINRANKARWSLKHFDDKLYTPPIAVSRSEHAQIESGLEAWTQSLLTSSFEIVHISKPLRPIWISPATTLNGVNVSGLDFHPVFCLSASKLIEGDGIERRLGYVYIQGSGDDHEMWSKGLTPRMYWENLSRLMATPADVLHDTIQEIVQTSKGRKSGSPACPVVLNAIKAAGSLIMLGTCEGAVTPDGWPDSCHSLIQLLPGTPQPDDDHAEMTEPAELHQELVNLPHLLRLHIPPSKRALQYFLSDVLPNSIRFARAQLLGDGRPKTLGIICWDGKDLSVGVAIAILQSLFDGDGSLSGEQYLESATKATLRTRLEWVQASHHQANPARATLKRVNEFFMSPARHATCLEYLTEQATT